MVRIVLRLIRLPAPAACRPVGVFLLSMHQSACGLRSVKPCHMGYARRLDMHPIALR